MNAAGKRISRKGGVVQLHIGGCFDLQAIMQLTEEQSRNLLAARRTYLTQVGSLLQQRRRLRDVMQVSNLPQSLHDSVIVRLKTIHKSKINPSKQSKLK